MKTEDKRISVIVPVYNAAGYLSDCLLSITGQTYRNLEILLIDDGSTDGSSGLCDEWSRKDNRIRVFHKENGGVSSARNMGLDKSRGNYIGFVDADDRIDRTMYEKLIGSITGSDMACCGYYNYPMDTLEVRIANGTRKAEPCCPEEAVFYLYERNGYFNSVWNKLICREAVFRNQQPVYFNTNYYVGEDEVWLAEVIMRCKTISFVPEPLYYWLPQKGSATRTGTLGDKEMTVLETKTAAMKCYPKDHDTRLLLEAAMYNDCHSYKTAAYCSGDRDKYNTIARAISPMKLSWKKSDRASRLNKLKVVLLELEMTLHLPVSVVRATASMRRFGIKRQ